MTDIHSKIESFKKTQNLIKDLQSSNKQLEDEIFKHIEKEVSSQLLDKEYGAGTANVLIGETKIKVAVSKKVTYEQDGLKKVFYQLRDMGQNPEEYIQTKYDVSESKYKAWPTSLKDLFKSYRIVEPSKPKLEIEV